MSGGGRRVAVFGGSFNPPHRGHQQLVALLLERDLADEVWVVPVYDHPFGKELAPFEDRLAMCRLAFSPLGPRVRVTDVERDLGGPSYTVRTLSELRRHLATGDELFLVVGADALPETESWRDFERVRELAGLLVVPRQGLPGEGTLDLPAPPGVSSSEVRERLGRGLEVTDLVPEAVARYLDERGLYRVPGGDRPPRPGPGTDASGDRR
jgi:nicotinate-nucleotide adenylyltransferase